MKEAIVSYKRTTLESLEHVQIHEIEEGEKPR